MIHKKTNNLISVDSETGTYFLGKRELVSQEQIDAIINYGACERKATDKNYATLDQARFNFDAMQIIRTTANYFGINLFGSCNPCRGSVATEHES